MIVKTKCIVLHFKQNEKKEKLFDFSLLNDLCVLEKINLLNSG